MSEDFRLARMVLESIKWRDQYDVWPSSGSSTGGDDAPGPSGSDTDRGSGEDEKFKDEGK